MASGGVPPSSFQFKYLEQTTAATTVSRQVHLGALLRGGLLKTIIQPMAGVTDLDEEIAKALDPRHHVDPPLTGGLGVDARTRRPPVHCRIWYVVEGGPPE